MQVHVFSKDARELEAIEEVFGGNHYRHGSGFVWIVSRRATIKQILDELEKRPAASVVGRLSDTDTS